MALLPVTDRDPPDRADLAQALAGLPPGAPIVVMIHGFRYCPDRPAHDPHRHILSLTPDRDSWKSVSWPRHLGLGGDGGLALGYGWRARGTIWQAHAEAARAGARLAGLLADLALLSPGRTVQLIGHSLGARVALCALERLPAGLVDRAILISAAVFREEARRILDTPAGRQAEVLHVTGRENTLFDLLLRAALPWYGVTVGRGLPERANWLDLPLDRPDCLHALRRHGYRIAAPRARICHWSGYLRPGVWRLYREFLNPASGLALAQLRAAADPARGLRARPARQDASQGVDPWPAGPDWLGASCVPSSRPLA